MKQIERKSFYGFMFSFFMVLSILAMNAVVFASPWIDVSGVTLDTTTVGTLGATILTALGTIWALRKLIKAINRS